VLAAQDQLASEQAAKDAISRQLEQAERRFEVGLIAITDVKEAQAGYDNAVALEIAAQRALASAKEALREITGEYPHTLAAPGKEFPLIPPNPQIEQDWVDISLQQNLVLESAKIGAEISRENIEIARSGHFPTLGLVGSYGNNETDGEGTTFDVPQVGGGVADVTNQSQRDADQWRVGIQFKLPIYSGGGVSSQVQQNVYLHRAAKENFEKVARSTERETRDSYLGVIAEIARVQALARSEDSNQTALEATEAGYEVGTRTTVDVLNARQSLFLAQTQYARSKYDYLINVIKLKQAAGTLNPNDVKELDSWLIVQDTLPATPGRGATPDVQLKPGTPTTGGALDLPGMAQPGTTKESAE
jgi:outer membrane protein